MNREDVIKLYRQLKIDRCHFEELLSTSIPWDAKELELSLDHLFSSLIAPNKNQSERQWRELYEHLSSIGIKMAESVLYPALKSFMTHIENIEGALGTQEHKRFIKASDYFGRSRWLTDYNKARPLYQELEKILFEK